MLTRGQWGLGEGQPQRFVMLTAPLKAFLSPALHCQDLGKACVGASGGITTLGEASALARCSVRPTPPTCPQADWGRARPSVYAL